ncbi:MAG: hypothetical protein M0P72_09780 [Metallibacterium scheffleri]|uniref:hypothetical protein n=1 Tax=Metallibacterium scheffleri TaxID=993689 RepID=UPI0026F33100|nr:hypothetical protein [Metallibacterium scheffleri]MCK9367420.1 hypothetical protein [Metallibacterium scheffleri]
MPLSPLVVVVDGIAGPTSPQLLRQIRRPRMVVPLEHAQILVPRDRGQLDQVARRGEGAAVPLAVDARQSRSEMKLSGEV